MKMNYVGIASIVEKDVVIYNNCFSFDSSVSTRENLIKELCKKNECNRDQIIEIFLFSNGKDHPNTIHLLSGEDF
jgi:hypothetical protein